MSSSKSTSPMPSSPQPQSKEYRPSFLERHGLKSSPTPPPYRTPEEEKAEALRLKKIEREKVKQLKEKERKKKEKEFAHANSSAGVYTQFYKNDDGSINWWRMIFYS